jgi:Right handed beta helix region
MFRPHRMLARSAVLAAFVLTAASSAYAVDGVVLIDQNRALAGNVTPGDAPGFPVTITKAGSYRLSSDLIISDINQSAIEIDTPQGVSIDLNGFSIRGVHNGGPRPCQAVTPGKGIGTGVGNSNNVDIRNGTIERMGCDGILLIGFNNIVQNVRVRNNGATGIQITGVIANNVVSENGAEGISTFDAVVTGNQVNGNDTHGIVIFQGVVSNNTVGNNTDLGLFVPGSGGNPGTRVAYSNNVFSNNNANGAQVFGGIQTGSNVCAVLSVGALCP